MTWLDNCREAQQQRDRWRAEDARAARAAEIPYARLVAMTEAIAWSETLDVAADVLAGAGFTVLARELGDMAMDLASMVDADSPAIEAWREAQEDET